MDSYFYHSLRLASTHIFYFYLISIRFLQDQARGILEKAKLEKELHATACNVLKRPGQLYFYYVRSSGQKYLSIMSPQDWGDKCPHEFLGGMKN